jgi:hypothetical protein
MIQSMQIAKNSNPFGTMGGKYKVTFEIMSNNLSDE